jgi:prevent-host-death family protein
VNVPCEDGEAVPTRKLRLVSCPASAIDWYNQLVDRPGEEIMTSVGTFEAKTHLTQLLERVSRGERIVITNRGRPVAMLVPPEARSGRDTAKIGREMLEYRDRVKRSLGGRSFRDVAHEGHRY